MHHYRADIDGLRAVAIVPVVLFHAGIAAFGGGFVGVDVFFVISGFLITGLIRHELDRGTFSIAGFYERRVRRLFPALFAMLLVVSACAAWLLLPADLVDYAKSVLATSLFASNFLFWQEAGYFGRAAEDIPLLHTWSLAVEEQFYILFPLFLAGGASIFIGMAQRYVEAATPFYQLYPARLAWLDIVAVSGIAFFYFQAMKLRRNVSLHSGYLLATAIFLLPPILGRLSPILPGLAIEGPVDFAKLMIGFQLANALTALIALTIGLRTREGRPFFIAAGLTLVAALLFQTVGGSPAWQALYARSAEVPAMALALIAGVAGIVIGWAGWTAGKRPARRTAPA